MKFIIISSVSYVVAVLAFIGFLSFVMWRNAFREFGYGYWLRMIVGVVALMWVFYGLYWLGRHL
ncbi:hypothetical protein MOR33_003140 [Salmonella enterica]|nr:hypothetical protein [Salmonella enterica]EGL7479205.1 hypothetical protein [Salmonella enterica]EIZ2334189.1 hypothetical protein [Salmonella enterica]